VGVLEALERLFRILSVNIRGFKEGMYMEKNLSGAV